MKGQRYDSVGKGMVLYMRASLRFKKEDHYAVICDIFNLRPRGLLGH